MGPIKLHCLSCKRNMDYDRSIDPDIPSVVVRIEGTACDRCDNGDFGMETWFNAEGEVVVPDEQDCPGHVASSVDPKLCRRCGVHIDSFRPDDEDPR